MTQDRSAVPAKASFPSPIEVSIDADTLDGAPYFAGRVIRGVKNGPSPAWLQQRLKAIGLRPISALVDITNFFTYDRNRPLHVFDADKVQGDLRVHRAKGGEQMLALDDKTYTFEPGMMVISDDHGARKHRRHHGRRGISGVTEETVNVFVESRLLGPDHHRPHRPRAEDQLRRQYRFERGVDPAFTLPGLEAATRDDPGPLRRRGVRGRRSRRGAGRHARAYRLDTARCSLAGRHGHPRRDAARDAGSAGLHAGRRHGDPADLAARCEGRGRPGGRSGAHRLADQPRSRSRCRARPRACRSRS